MSCTCISSNKTTLRNKERGSYLIYIVTFVPYCRPIWGHCLAHIFVSIVNYCGQTDILLQWILWLICLEYHLKNIEISVCNKDAKGYCLLLMYTLSHTENDRDVTERTIRCKTHPYFYVNPRILFWTCEKIHMSCTW